MSAVPTPSAPRPSQLPQNSPYAPPSAPVDRDGVELGDVPAAYAGFWVRFCAAFLDGILLTVVLFLVSFVAGMVAAFMPGASAEYVANLTVLFAIVASWPYYALQESSGYQATLGKRAFKLRVATQHDHPRISFARATGRYFARSCRWRPFIWGT